jgi:POT family proton-dependent oligopeptide transporter
LAETGAAAGNLPVTDTRPQWFGHPAQLARLFTTEMWERFGFYGMRALLVLYLTQHFIFSDRVGSGMYGAYMSLVYLTPFIGGLLADRYLGSKRAVKFGALVMSAGYLLLCFGGETARPFVTFDGLRHEVTVAQTADGSDGRFVVDAGQRLQIKGRDNGSVDLLRGDGSVVRSIGKADFASDAARSPFYVTIMLFALSLIVIGNGFFKPNISTMVGSLYAKGDRRRDAGFTIFYMGINLGSLGSQILCPFLAVAFGWWAGFGLAAAGMLVAWALIQFDGGKLDGYGEAPTTERDRSVVIYLAAIAAIVVPWLLFSNTLSAAAPVAGAGITGYLLGLPVLGKALFVTFIIGVPAILVWSWRVGSRTEFQMMVAAMVLIVFNVTFWTLFEQAGSSLTLFADRNTNLSVFGLFSISAGQTQFFNALFIVALAPLFGAMWIALAKRGMEPGIPVKFGIALVGVGLGFLFLVWGTSFVGPDYKVGLWWLAGLYLIHSMAELCISPVGLSMITKLSIARIVGMMMGVWFLSISVAQYVGGIVAQLASVETVGGEVTNLSVSLTTYAGVFQTIGLASAAIGGILLAISPLLKRWMHGVN